METNFKLYKKCRNHLLILILLSVAILIVGVVADVMSMYIAGALGILIFSVWKRVLKKDFLRHIKLMEEHSIKGPREIMAWLLSANEQDQEDLLGYLSRDDLQAILSAVKDHIVNYPNKTEAIRIRQKIEFMM